MPTGWGWVDYFGVPPIAFVLARRPELLAGFSERELLQLPGSIPIETLEGLKSGRIELKAIRAGDIFRDDRSGKYAQAEPATVLGHSGDHPFICAGQYPPPGGYEVGFRAALGNNKFFATSALELFNLIRLSKVVTLGVSSLHLFGALLGDAKTVHYPVKGHFDPIGPGVLHGLIPDWWVGL